MLTSTPGKLALLPVTVMVVLLGVTNAPAHARLLRSTPADKATLGMAPAKVDFWFSELLDEGFNLVEVYPAAELNVTTRTNLVRDGAAVDPADRTHLTAALQPLAAGSYIVDFRVLSRDGHTAPGRITFTVSAMR